MFQNGQLTVLNMRDILPNRFQPRIRFDEEKLEELADSISKYGVIQPIVVRPVGSRVVIIAGERRFKASKLASRSTIPAIVVNLSDKDSEEIALLENVQRQELSPIEEAVSYKRILDMGYITQEQLAQKIGKAQSTIANKIRLLNLDDEVQSYLLNNKISERHARSLLRIPDKEKQVEMLHRIVEERLTVKQTDREIEKLKEETQINNRPAKSETINIKTSTEEVNNIPVSEEIESLFDEEEKREGNTMDIDKIMREAKDINVEQDVAPKDISGLMQPGNDVQSEPIIREEASNSVNLENNKFINVAPQPEKTKVVQSQPVSGGVTFDSMFNQHVDIEQSSNNQNSASVANSNVQPSVSSVPVSSPAPSLNENTFVQQNVQPVVDPNLTVTHGNENNIAQTGVPEISNQVVENDVTEDTKKVISSAVADALRRFNAKKSSQNDVSTNNLVSGVAPVSPNLNTEPTPLKTTPEVTPIVNQPISDISIDNVSQPSIPSTDIIADNTLNEYAVHPNANPVGTMASTVTQNVKPVNNQAHFAQIVKLLRDCADKIEQNGYFVSMDEMDLGNQYKVTFTINKE